MSFPKVVIKYEIPPPIPLIPPTSDTGAGGGGEGGGGGGGISIADIPLVSTASAGLAPIIPSGSGGVPHSFLRDDAGWSGVSYAELSDLPASFLPSPHAASHVLGPDLLPLPTQFTPGLVPPLPANPNFVLAGSGTWTSISVLSGPVFWDDITDKPPSFPPSAHASTHVSGPDKILGPTTAAPGLVPPIPNDTSKFFRGDGIFASGVSGPAGQPAYTSSLAPFTVPPLGSSVTVSVKDTSWMAIGEILWIDDAGGPGVAGAMKIASKTVNTVTLLNI